MFSFLQIETAQARFMSGTPQHNDFFDFDRAVSFWNNLKTGEQYDAEYAKCSENEDYNRWDSQWLSRSATTIEDLTLEGEDDRELMEYCHDLSRTYDLWASIYKNIIGLMQDSWTGHRPVADAWNEWSAKACETRIYVHPWGAEHGYYNANIFTGECNDLPDWRLPDQVKEYDTILANSVIRSGKKNEQSRAVVSNYLAKHGDTLSQADRDALETIIKDLQ